MFGFFLTLLILNGILLVTVVLLQAGQGGGLASLGGGAGTGNIMGGRQATTLLTRATWWTGGIFMGLSLILGLLHTRDGASVSEVQRRLQQQNSQQGVAPAPIGGTGGIEVVPAPIEGAAPGTPEQ